MVTKISIIGAGSAVFSLGMIRDLCLTPGLAGSVVSLMDINEDRLHAIHRLCERYIAETGADIRAEATTDTKASLTDADFVVNTALAAGHDRLRAGWRHAEALGYRFGGSLHVMHDEPFWVNYSQFRLFEDLLDTMRLVCPQAWYVQVANPVLAGITFLSEHYPDINMVGTCHGYAAVYGIARVLGLDPQGLTYEIPGVNHNVWLTSIHHDGTDVWPLLDAWIEREAATYWETNPRSDGLGPQAIDLYQRFGVFPIGDTCTTGGGSWPWWYHADEATEERWREDPTTWWADHFRRGDEEVRHIERAASATDQRVTDAFPPEMSGEVMVPLIEAIVTDTPAVIIGNVRNSGNFVPGIPQHFAVEIPLHVSKRGIRGIATAPLPPAVLAHIGRDRIAPVSLELAAYREGSRERLVELVLTDPWTRSLDQAEALVDTILAMPEHEAMRNHYR